MALGPMEFDSGGGVPSYISVGNGGTRRFEYGNSKCAFIALGRDVSYKSIYFVDIENNRITTIVSTGTLDSNITVSIDTSNREISISNSNTTYAQGIIIFSQA